MPSDEENFESAIPSQSPTASRHLKKHASQTVVVPSHDSKDKTEASPSSVILGKGVIVETKKGERDRINNLPQKEKKLEEAGVTRRKAYQIIADALEAEIVSEWRDSEGRVQYKKVADWERRKWGAEMTIKMFGDAIERKEVEYDIADGALAKLKTLTVSELKSRALDILAGKVTSTRLPTEGGVGG